MHCMHKLQAIRRERCQSKKCLNLLSPSQTKRWLLQFERSLFDAESIQLIMHSWHLAGLADYTRAQLPSDLEFVRLSIHLMQDCFVQAAFLVRQSHAS